MEPFEVTPVEEATTKPRDSVPVYKQGQRVVFIDQQGSYSGVVCWSQKDGPPMVGIKADDVAVASKFKQREQGAHALFLPESRVKPVPPEQCTECVALDSGQTLKETARVKYLEQARRVIAAHEDTDQEQVKEKVEIPIFDRDIQVKEYYDKMPVSPPQRATEEYKQLIQFCSEVEIILHTVNHNDYQAILTYMEPPAQNFKRAIQHCPKHAMVVGMFAGKKAVVVQTLGGAKCRQKISEALDAFPNALCIIAVGACYAFEHKMVKLGDVIVSEKISDLAKMKLASDAVLDQGETIDVRPYLSDIFCVNTIHQPFHVTCDRISEVHSGQFISSPHDFGCYNVHAARPSAVGGETEGGVVMQLLREKNSSQGIVVIKGVAGYADGKEDDQWRYTASKAALHYIMSKLEGVDLLDQASSIQTSASQIQLQIKLEEHHRQEITNLERQSSEQQISSQETIQALLASHEGKDKEIARLQYDLKAKEQQLQRKKVQIEQLQEAVDLNRSTDDPEEPLTLIDLSSNSDLHQSWNIPRDQIQSIDKCEIGRGAWGVVYSGTFRGERVAIKQAHREVLDHTTIDMLKREVKIMAHLQHPNLVRFIAAVIDDAVENATDLPIIVSELMDMNLRVAYKKHGLSGCAVISIFLDVAYALHYLHQHHQPIVHRDISAPNVLLKSLQNGVYQAKVSDFGSANLAKQAQTAGAGAIAYCAPEMFPGELTTRPEPQTTKVDVFSYGILMLEVLAKEMPTPETRFSMQQKLNSEQESMHQLIVKCTELVPSNRPSMSKILKELNRINTSSDTE